MLTDQDKQKLTKAGYNDAQIHAYEVKKFGVPEQKSSAAESVNNLKTLYGGSENGIASKLSQDVQAGAADIQKGGVADVAKGVVKAGARTAGDVATTVFAPITAAVEATGVSKLFQKAGEAIVNTGLGNAVTDNPYLQRFAMEHPNAGEDIGRAANIATAAAEGATPKATKTLPGALAREASTISPSISGESATAALSRKLYETGIGRNTAEAERTLNYRAEKQMGNNATPPTTRATVAQKYGIAGRQADIGVQAKVTGIKLYRDQILPELKKSPEVLTKEELFTPLKEKIDNTVDPSRKAELQDAYDALSEDYSKESTWSLEKAQQLKSGIDKTTPDKVFKGKPIANAFNELRHDMADNIRAFTYDKLSDVGIKQKYLDYGNLLELQKLGVEGLSNNKLKGGAGSFITGLIDKTVTPIATGAGKILYKIDNTPITFKAPAGVKTFGQFLEDHGYDTRNLTKGAIKNPLASFDYGKVIKGIDNTDANILTEYADSVGKGKSPSPEIAKKVQNTLDYFGTPGRFGKQADVFKDVTNILDARRQSLK